MQNIMRKQMTESELPVSERLELKELKDRLAMENGRASLYGTSNLAFNDEVSPLGSETTEKLTLDMITADEADKVFRDGEDGRESWDSKLQFMLATIGYAVGLGNVWRFPYLAQKNGGGAFLIPYFMMLAVMGIPVFYLELAVGQRLRKGAIGAWNLVSTYMGGIGIASAVVSFNVALYYNTIIAWCIFYLLNSFESPLPWANCPKDNYPNGTYVNNSECSRSSPTQYFWYRETLNISNEIENFQDFNWKIAGCLLLAWILCYLCMVKGIASSGKVVYVTATFPYFVLLIFFFRGITLKGMSAGVSHLFTPKWSKLLDPIVWLEAGTQIFFSLGLGFGGLIAFSSYNPVHNNCYRDAIFVALTNCGTSMFAGIVVFSILGFKAHQINSRCIENRTNYIDLNGLKEFPMLDGIVYLNSTATIHLDKCDIQEELDKGASGTGLAFIVFTEAINEFPFAPLWSILFFLMLFTLGIDSQFGTLEGAVTSIVDLKLFPNLRKEILTGFICLVSFLLSLVFAHGAGSYIFTLFDNFAGNFPLLIIAFFECIAIAFVYGLKRFSDDLELMTGKRPNHYMLFCWRYAAPCTMLIILISSLVRLSQESGYDAWDSKLATVIVKEWPGWAKILATLLIVICAVWIPLVALLKVIGRPLLPEEDASWFPADELRIYHGIKPHRPTRWERLIFAMKDDFDPTIESDDI
ncbi:sodium-dependent neutral amino acid transporter B(0)AT3-like [Panonychus citri]|uniref:sodium-dependent neutral amino acid transporter B(0)AT3-like n=1 Tax=Panonychus citri TaxID=50023 RepID=UPI0023071597|nr:sodium-dependent neutral amino acid transporter B(0)AT3-like [Panonychus citri]